MFAPNCTYSGPLSRATEFYYFLKTLDFFMQLVRQEAGEQGIPSEVVRVLQACRGYIVLSKQDFFVVLAFQGDADPLASEVFVNSHEARELTIKQAEALGIPCLFRDKNYGDPLTLRSRGTVTTPITRGRRRFFNRLSRSILFSKSDGLSREVCYWSRRRFFEGITSNRIAEWHL